MKPCPIRADSACCKHCFMGPCRLNSKEPYAKVGVCGATIDTIAARNFARAVASGAAAHTDHAMGILDVFRGVVNGEIKAFKIKDEDKLRSVAASIGIAVEGRETLEIAKDLHEVRNPMGLPISGVWPLPFHFLPFVFPMGKKKSL